MKADKFTEKTTEALGAAQQLAGSRNHQAVGLAHLVLTLVQQQGGVVGLLLEKVGVESPVILVELEKVLSKVPKVSGGQPYMSSELEAAFQAAQAHADLLGDKYLSTEHLFLAA